MTLADHRIHPRLSERGKGDCSACAANRRGGGADRQTAEGPGNTLKNHRSNDEENVWPHADVDGATNCAMLVIRGIAIRMVNPTASPVVHDETEVLESVLGQSIVA